MRSHPLVMGGRRRLGLAISLIFLVCLSSAAGTDAADAQRPAEGYTIGCILPLSGRYAAYGNRALDAILLAAGVFDPVKETPIRILIEDSRSEPAVAGAAVGQLARAGVTCILGPLGSQEALEAAREAQRLKIPILTMTQREGITAVGDQVFRNFLTAAMQVRAVVQYARVELGLHLFAILYPDDAYGREMARLFREEVRVKGCEILKEISYRSGETDFGESILALGGVAPLGHAPEGGTARTEPAQTPSIGYEALFIPDSYLRVAMIVPQLVYYDLTDIQLLGTSGWNSPELLKAAPEHLQGSVFVDGFFTDSFRPEVNDFVDAFHLAYGRVPDAMEALVYDSAGIAVRVLLENCGGTREAFRVKLMSLKGYPGVTGWTSFPPSRDADRELFVLTVKDGQIIQLK